MSERCAYRSAFPRRFEAAAGVCQCCDGLGYWINLKAAGVKVRCGPCKGTGHYVLPERKPKGERSSFILKTYNNHRPAPSPRQH